MKYKLFEFIALKNEALNLSVEYELTHYHKNELVLMTLFQFLIGLTEEALENLDAIAIFKTLKLNHKYTDGYQRQLMIKIQKIYEKKLYQFNSEIDQIQLSKIFRKHALKKNYNALLTEIEQQIEIPKYKAEDYLNSIDFYNEKINQGLFLNKITHQEIKSLTLAIDKNLNTFYIVHKLKNLLSIINIDKSFDLTTFEYYNELREIIYSEKYNEIELIYLYKHCYLLQADTSGTSYEIVKNILFKEHSLMDLNEKKDISALLSNFCIKKINTQNFEFYQELMSLYKFNIAYHIVLENEVILHSTFRNYVQIALRCNETEWAKEFINAFQKHLKPIERESTVSICSALISFNEKKYQRTIKELTQVNFHDHQLDILARLLLSRAYYELDETETLGYLIDSFKKYIQRNKKIDPRLIIPCKNYLKTLNSLLSLNPRDSIKINKLYQTIHGHTQIAEKQWLLEKINEFKND